MKQKNTSINLIVIVLITIFGGCFSCMIWDQTGILPNTNSIYIFGLGVTVALIVFVSYPKSAVQPQKGEEVQEKTTTELIWLLFSDGKRFHKLPKEIKRLVQVRVVIFCIIFGVVGFGSISYIVQPGAGIDACRCVEVLESYSSYLYQQQRARNKSMGLSSSHGGQPDYYFDLHSEDFIACKKKFNQSMPTDFAEDYYEKYGTLRATGLTQARRACTAGN